MSGSDDAAATARAARRQLFSDPAFRAGFEAYAVQLRAKGPSFVLPSTTEETIDCLANPYPVGSADAIAWRRGAALADQETGDPDSWHGGDADVGVDERTLRMGLRAKRLRDSVRPPPEVVEALQEIPVEVAGHAVHRVIAVSVTHDDDDHAEVLLEIRS